MERKGRVVLRWVGEDGQYLDLVLWKNLPVDAVV